jgi:tripartite ATP-independent transporter DctM subunit
MIQAAPTLIGFAALFFMLFLGMPIAVAMGLVGVAGFAVLVGFNPALAMLGQTVFEASRVADYAVLPLFVLMGNLVSRSGISEKLYAAAYAFLGHFRGGLALSTLAACGGFSAVSGSSLATAATMAKVAMPPMRKYKYKDTLATGSIAAGGTLGILIPPSTILVLYGIMANADIGKLFIAGILPGILTILLYFAAVSLVVRVDPSAGPASDPLPWSIRFGSLKGVWGMLCLFGLVMGVIYLGVCTATEAAGIGASGAFLIALSQRTMSARDFVDVLVETGRTTAMMFGVLFGALVFSNFVNIARMPQLILGWLELAGASPSLVILAIILVYLVLGCVLESFSMVLLTVPIFLPVVQAVGFDIIWFGILVVIMMEISLITPPIGMNVFVLKSVLSDVQVGTIFRGVLPFLFADVFRLILICAVPQIVLILPRVMD